MWSFLFLFGSCSACVSGLWRVVCLLLLLSGVSSPVWVVRAVGFSWLRSFSSLWFWFGFSAFPWFGLFFACLLGVDWCVLEVCGLALGRKVFFGVFWLCVRFVCVFLVVIMCDALLCVYCARDVGLRLLLHFLCHRFGFRSAACVFLCFFFFSLLCFVVRLFFWWFRFS